MNQMILLLESNRKPKCDILEKEKKEAFDFLAQVKSRLILSLI